MSEQTAVVTVDGQVPAEWGDPAQVRAMALKMGKVLQNASDFTADEMIIIGNYCLVTGLNPMRGEVYFYKNRGRICVVDGYKALVRWAERHAPYTDWDEDLPLEKGQIAHVRRYIQRQDRLVFVDFWMRRGLSIEAATLKSAQYGDGVVTEADLRGRDGPKEPPTGWTWRDVARKRALKNALNQSHGAPSIKEIAEDSWKVNGVVTIEGDWEAIPDHVLEQGAGERYAEGEARARQIKAEMGAKTPEEKQATLNANNKLLRGDESDGFDTPTVTAPPTFEEEPEAEPESVEQPEQKPGKRPYNALVVRAKVHEGAGWEGGARLLDGEPVTDGQKKALGGLMGKVAAKDGMTQAEIDKSRHDILEYLVGVRSINDLYKREASALIHWLKSPDEGSWELNEFAAQEAAAIWTALGVEQGQLAMTL